MRKINFLSVFDGISCGQQAAKEEGVNIGSYYASEINESALTVTKDRHKETVHLGDVKNVHVTNIGIEVDLGPGNVRFIRTNVDVLIGGSPCQDLRPGRDGLRGSKSILFFEYNRILYQLRQKNPKVLFLFENVGKISKSDQAIISELLGVEPIKINSAVVSAQNRVRLYWTNIPQTETIKEVNVRLSDILESNVDPKYTITDKALAGFNRRKANHVKKGNGYGHNVIDPALVLKSPTILARYYKDAKECLIHQQGQNPRRLTPVEIERLFGLPDGYTSSVSTSKRIECCGNGWSVGVIRHFMRGLKSVFNED